MKCRCGHDRAAHRHYRKGTDCSLCDCPRFRKAPRGLQRHTPLRRVSRKRAAQNRQRKTMAGAAYPEQPRCEVPWCTLLADDLHEVLTRARGGSITDQANTRAVCRGHNEELTLEPAWGYDLGFLAHSWETVP